MIGLPALPQHSGALRAREAVVALERPAIANHSFRTYVWALLAGEKRGMRAGADFDADLLFYACVLHDLGTADAHDGPSRFEVEGADAAAELLAAQGVGSAEIDQVWEAIALHTSPHIAERRGPLSLLTRLGVLADFQGPGADHSQLVAETERAYPRLDIERELTDAVVSQALRKPEKAPEHSWPGGLLRARLDATPPP